MFAINSLIENPFQERLMVQNQATKKSWFKGFKPIALQDQTMEFTAVNEVY